jgi:hypothetical protein
MPFGFRDPTEKELILSLLSIHDDMSWYTCRDQCLRQGFSFIEQDYEKFCTEIFGFVPLRVLNLTPENPWGYPAGPDYCQPDVLGPLPPGLTQYQIKQINEGVPLANVVMRPTIRTLVDVPAPTPQR